MNSRKNEISNPADETCAWLSKHPIYQKWRDKQHGLLWIKGKPGAEKSTVMKYAFISRCLHNEKRPKHVKLVVASFFFHGRGVMIQKSALGLFRSLLHQILQEIPESLQAFSLLFEKRRQTEGNYGERWEWQERDLQDFFENHIIEAAITHRIQIYVDALDECGKKVAQGIIKFFKLIMIKSDSLKAFLDICFSCRHYPIVILEKELEICVEHENRIDTEKYIQDHFRSIILHNNTAETVHYAEKIHDEVINKARGNFQWVVLVIAQVLELCEEGQSWKNIEKHVQRIPSELNALYQKLLKDIDDKELPETLQLMQWILFATRSLSLTELRFAIIVDADTSYTSIRQCQEASEFIETDEQMKKRVRYLSRGLTEITKHDYGNQIVQFNHQTVRDYLLQDGLQVLNKYLNGSVVGYAHFRLARSSFRYIDMDELSYLRQPENPWDIRAHERYILELKENFPFLEYAITSWIPHVKRVEEEKISQKNLLNFLHWHYDYNKADNIESLLNSLILRMFRDRQSSFFTLVKTL